MEMGAMYLEEQLARIRAGRANVAILDGVRVSSWGSMVPLNQVANVTVPDPRTIAIRPFDKKQIRDIEKAIMDSDVGITPENNGEIIRLGIPQPTEERRKDLVKQCNKIGERTEDSRQVREEGGGTPRCKAEGNYDCIIRKGKRVKQAASLYSFTFLLFFYF